MSIQYLHTMVRVSDIDASLKFFCDGLGLTEVSRMDSEAGRFTLVFLATPEDVERMGGMPDGVSPTQRWAHGIYSFARRHLGRIAAKGRAAVTERAVGERREYRRLVGPVPKRWSINQPINCP